MRKKLFIILPLLVLVSTSVYADVSNEFIVGLSGGSTKDYKYKDNLTGVTTDIEDIEEANALFGLQYTRFFSPLKEDGSSIELRRFHQHPSAFSVLLAGYAEKMEDKTNPLSMDESELSSSFIGLTGEFYLPTHTGIVLDVLGGGGEYTEKTNGIDTLNADMEVRTYTAGVKQYLFDALELGIDYSNEENTAEFKGILSGFDMTTEEKILTGRARLIIADTIGLLAEYGSGEIESSSNIPFFTPNNYDITDAAGELNVYAGRGFSIRIGGNVRVEKQKDLPAGSKAEMIETKGYISPKFWFNENFGIELLSYSTKIEENTAGSGYDDTNSHVENGGEINISFRF